MRRNRLRELLPAGRPSLGTHVHSAWSHPRVIEAERHVIKTALRLGIAARAEISHPSEAKPYLDLGVRHFCMGWDVSVLFDYFKTEGGALRDLLGAG